MAIDAARYRQIVGHFATGVTVVTTAHEGWLHGMTANAVTSVSLNPLLLLVCVDKTANMHEQITKAGRFTREHPHATTRKTSRARSPRQPSPNKAVSRASRTSLGRTARR